MAVPDTPPRKPKRSRIAVSLFGLVFLLVGVGMLVLSPVQTLHEHLSSADWDRVPATLEYLELETHRGSDSTTWSVEARYRYLYGGRQYVSTRVGYDEGSDNIGDYHHRLQQRLMHRSNRGEVRAWVNPDAPSESYLVRELRWQKLLFTSVFGLVFAAAGLFVLFMARRTSTSPNTGEKPITSSEKHGFWLFGFMAFAFIGLSLPGVLAIPDEAGKGNWMILLVLLFPLAGIWLAHMAWKALRNWRYYGPAPLQLDPAPGQIGGDIGGRITLERRIDTQEWTVTLQCVRVRISGSGKNRSRHESVLWQADQAPEVHQRAGGTELQFCLSPPADLPATDDQGSRQIEWRLLLTGPSEPVALERTYTLPAQPGDNRSSISLTQAHVRHHQQRERLDAITHAAEQIDVQATGNGLAIHSRAGRNLGMKGMILVFGLIFSAIGIGLGYIAAEEGFMLYVMAAAFCLFGFPMVVGAIFMAGRSLSARIEGERVTVVRYWCGRALWQRRGNLTSADQLSLDRNATTSQGRKTTEYFSLSFRDGRKSIRLAEGIIGRPVAEAFHNNLVTLLRLG